MVRQTHRQLRAFAAVLAAALALAGCGIKGPLVPPAKADAAKGAAKDSDSSTPKKP